MIVSTADYDTVGWDVRAFHLVDGNDQESSSRARVCAASQARIKPRGLISARSVTVVSHEEIIRWLRIGHRSSRLTTQFQLQSRHRSAVHPVIRSDMKKNMLTAFLLAISSSPATRRWSMRSNRRTTESFLFPLFGKTNTSPRGRASRTIFKIDEANSYQNFRKTSYY